MADLTVSSNVDTLLQAADYAAMRTLLSLVIGTNVQAYSTELGKLGVHGSDIASAGTINLETATGNVVDVTGTTTITAATLSEGHVRIVRFTGALELTHNASTFILPVGGNNIVTEAGDYAIFIGYAAGVVRVLYFRASGLPLVVGMAANGANATLPTGNPGGAAGQLYTDGSGGVFVTTSS